MSSPNTQRAALGLGSATTVGCSPNIPTPSDNRPSRICIQHINHQLDIHGILWSPQVVYTCKYELSRFGYTLALVTALLTRFSSCSIVTIIFQVFRPLWPFFAASGITYYLVSKAQDMAVRCALFHIFSHLPAHTFFSNFSYKAEGFRNDPRNPYAAQIAKEEHH